MTLLKRLKNLWKLSEYEPKKQIFEALKPMDKEDWKKLQPVTFTAERKFTPAEIIYKKKPLEKVINDITNDN